MVRHIFLQEMARKFVELIIPSEELTVKNMFTVKIIDAICMVEIDHTLNL
jgi:hypothetical protein